MNGLVPSLRRNFVWSFTGNIVYAACLWGILVVLTKVGSPSAVGRYALASAIATPVFAFANMQLRAVMVSDAKNRHDFRDYLGVRLLALPIAFAVVVVIAVLGYSAAQIAAICIFGLARAVEATSDIFYGYAQKRERLDLVAMSMIIKGLCALALFSVTFRLTGNLVPALGAMAVGWAVPLLFFDIRRNRVLLRDETGAAGVQRPRIRALDARRIVWTALPLGLVMLMIQLRNTIPRTMLENARGEEALGIFSALVYIVVAGNTVVMALSQSGIARLSRAYAAGDMRAFRSTVIKLVRIGLLMGVAGVLVARFAGRPLLAFIYRPEYAEHETLFLLIMAAGGVLYVGSLLGAPATAMRAFREQLFIHSLSAAVLVVLGRLLIPSRGMMGAAWTMLGSAVTVTACYAAVVVRGMRRPVDGRDET